MKLSYDGSSSGGRLEFKTDGELIDMLVVHCDDEAFRIDLCSNKKKVATIEKHQEKK